MVNKGRPLIRTNWCTAALGNNGHAVDALRDLRSRERARKWNEMCLEYSAQRTELEVDADRPAFAALTVNLNIVTSRDDVIQREGARYLALKLGFPVDRK